MKEFIEIIILGIVQGLTEFLPVSSSGHLILLQEVFGITENTLFTTIVLHLGTLFAVIIYYFKDLTALIKPENHKTVFWLFVATIPACIFGLIFSDFFEKLTSSKLLCYTFLFTSIMLLCTQIIAKRTTVKREFCTRSAIVMGLSQCVALLPGISRSGSTIFGGILTKNDPKAVAKFSFFMSIPIILGSLVLELFKVELTHINWAVLGVGFFTSFIFGLLAIRLMMKIIGKCNFKWFSAYLVILSIICFVQNYIYVMW